MAHRRPDTDDNMRIKRRKTSPDSDSGSEDGGVSLDPKYWGSDRPVKEESPEKEEFDNYRQVKEEPPGIDSSIYHNESKAERVENGFQHRKSSMKAEPSETKYNPYLAHLDVPVDETSGYSNGYRHGLKSGKLDGTPSGTTIGHFPRHGTNAAMAKKAEDGPNNPFTGKPLSTQYFNILKTRRNLPVHAQRLVFSHIVGIPAC